jgi:glucose-1-phosphate adenylyltransferase
MSVLTLILAGGAGSRLSIFGEKRAKPAVPFAGKYRIIDFPLSNAVNSDLYRIAVLTQYRPRSLMDHIGMGEPWDLNRRWPNDVCRSGSPIAGARTRIDQAGIRRIYTFYS